MPDIVTLGEALIDLVSTQSGVSLAEAPGFVRAAGGAPANVAVALARLGNSAGFIGKVGADPFGDFLRRTLSDEGVDTSCMLSEESARTALAFVSLMGEGERDFVFYRNPSADMFLAESDIDAGYLADCRIFHHGSISLITEPNRTATWVARQTAASAGAVISYDPNIRLSLWPDAEEARAGAREAVTGAHLIKVSTEELTFITGHEDLDRGCDAILEMGVKLVTVTLGAAGSYYKTAAVSGRVPGFKVDVVDTTGAGDAFAAGVLSGLVPFLKQGRGICDLEQDDYYRILRLANAVGALVTTERGVIPSLPTRAEVEGMLEAALS